MPKLVIKQDVGTAGRKARQGKWLSLGGLLLLLITVAGAAYFFTRPVITSPTQVALALDSAQDPEIKTQYLAMHQTFNELGGEYDKLSSQGVDDYVKNIKLLNKSEDILVLLDEMSALADQLGLDNDEYKQLFNRQQFNKDYWQSKAHFRQLRVSRFEEGSKGADLANVARVQPASLVQEIAPVIDEGQTTVADKPKKFRFAQPPAGMELPAGFCDLSNSGSCKPEVAEAGVSDGMLALPEDVPAPEAESLDPPRKFRFAKPPAGMELPAGFCDLSNSGSCKPEVAEAGVSDETLVLPENLPASEAESLEPPRKFKFAKPPPGMELPEGFCDLNNPDSCKPEVDVKMAGEESNKVN